MLAKEMTKCDKIKTYPTYNISQLPKRLKNANRISVNTELPPKPNNFVIVVSNSNKIIIKRYGDILLDDYLLQGVITGV